MLARAATVIAAVAVLAGCGEATERPTPDEARQQIIEDDCGLEAVYQAPGACEEAQDRYLGR